MNQDEFLEQARRAGLNEETALTYGVKPLAAHAARLGQDAGPWLDALYDFVAILHARGVELWSPLRFTLMPLAEAADGDAAHFAALLDADRDLLLDLRDKNIETTRTEQYGVAAAARALAADGVALTRALEFARGVAAKGANPGWLLQTFGAGAGAARKNPRAVERAGAAV
jgi:post-segregation antitoxin (ccd killing protein)